MWDWGLRVGVVGCGVWGGRCVSGLVPGELRVRADEVCLVGLAEEGATLDTSASGATSRPGDCDRAPRLALGGGRPAWLGSLPHAGRGEDGWAVAGNDSQ